jgi:hypothetical protein
MDDESREWVAYIPPKSTAHGHQSRIRDPRRAWPTVERFLVELTTFTLGPRAKLICHGPSAHTDAAVTAARLEEARRCFGPEDASEAVGRIDRRWTLNASQVAAALQFALDDDKFPEQQLGPTWLSFSYQFFWTEIEQSSASTSAGDARNRMSFLVISAGQRRLFLQPAFVYPAPWTSESLKEFINRTEAIVPFRFREQNFKRWLARQSPANNTGRHLKLDANWRHGKSSSRRSA